MNPDLSINLSGIPPERWTENRDICAVCRQSTEDEVPLLLWRNDGSEMLRLCWDCANKRIGSSDVLSGSE